MPSYHCTKKICWPPQSRLSISVSRIRVFLTTVTAPEGATTDDTAEKTLLQTGVVSGDTTGYISQQT